MKMCNHRLIAIVLSCLLCFTAVPITAFAVGAAGTEETMTEETGTEAATASVEEMTEDFTDASMDGTETGEAAESTDVEIEEPPAPETEAASDTETAETSDPEAETPPADTSDPETEEPPAETPGTETEEPPVDEPMETPPAETPAVQPEYRVQVDAVEGYHNQPVALTIRLEDVGGTGWTKLEASTEENAPEKRADLTEALQKDGAAPYTVSTNGTVYFFITDPAGTEHKETYTVDFFDYDPPAVEAGIHNKTLTVEATDLRSGVAGIYVNGQLYTTMKNGQLELPIDGCTEDRLFSIRAKDRLGNRSDSLTLSNPYYKEPEEEDTERIRSRSMTSIARRTATAARNRPPHSHPHRGPPPVLRRYPQLPHRSQRCPVAAPEAPAHLPVPPAAQPRPAPPPKNLLLIRKNPLRKL